MNDIEKIQIELDKLKQNKNRETKKEYSKIIVSIVITMNILFTLAIMYIFLKTKTEPSTLITAFFSFTTIELWQLSKIKRSKINKE